MMHAMAELRAGEFHRFRGKEREYIYLVPSGAVFELTPLSSLLLAAIASGATTVEPLKSIGAADGHTPIDVDEALEELRQVRAISAGEVYADPVQQAPMPFP